METLIWNGSPRKTGDTVNLINRVTAGIDGEYYLVNTYECGIAPCVDCRYCWQRRC